MPQSLFYLYGHVVFSTKRRQPFITKAVEHRVHAYMAGILRKIGCEDVHVGGTEDHTHSVFNFPKSCEPVKVVQYLKQDSSKWIKALSTPLGQFTWQRGYALFSVSPADLKAATEYVRDQREHHRTMTFQEELRRFFKKHNVEFDERYVWD